MTQSDLAGNSERLPEMGARQVQFAWSVPFPQASNSSNGKGK